ncbi:MAG: uroporphyrinogen decarboxylase family protein [Planctomycetaceae bacterium]|nr:hypothetical protein [Planctomycetaceae bacterium]
MTPRQRMREFFAGRAVDRIPNGLGGCETAGMHLLAYDNLKGILGVADPLNRMYTFMTNAVFEPSVLAAMEGDMIVLNSRMSASPLWGPPARGRWKDQVFWGKTFQVPAAWQFETHRDGTIWWDKALKCPPGGIYFDWPSGPPKVLELPDMDAQPSPADFNPSHDLPQEMLADMEAAARFLHETTDYSIVVGESIHDLQLKPGGMHAWWMRMRIEPQACHEYLAKAVDAGLAHLRQVHQAVGKYADAMIIADDIGDTRGVTCGPDLWREIYKPHYKRLWNGWKTITHMKSLLHCCGSVVDIMDDFIDCGLDIFNPIQVSARGMDVATLAARFGGRIIFYGGALDAVVTPPPTPDELVYEQASKVIETLAQAGRYIFAGTHNIPGDTPPGHLRAILDAYNSVKYTAAPWIRN